MGEKRTNNSKNVIVVNVENINITHNNSESSKLRKPFLIVLSLAIAAIAVLTVFSFNPELGADFVRALISMLEK